MKHNNQSAGRASSPMKEFAFCGECLTPNTWPDAQFDAEGVCLPCRYFELMKEIDWTARRREIEDIADWGRRNSDGAYDCIIGVSGGKDSHRQAFYARDQLGLKPLLVSCAYPPEQQTERGATNLANLARHGFDIHIIAPAPLVSKKLMDFSFRKHGNLFRASELALYASLPREAIAHRVPLILLGENPGLVFGGSVGSTSGDAGQQRNHHTLGGATIEPWLECGLERKELICYQYPSDHDLDRAGLRLVYLGYYIGDFNDTENSRFAEANGMQPRTGIDADPAETGSLNSADALDDDFVHINQFIKYLKFGFGKVTQQASVQIRLGNMSRETGIELLRKYDGQCSRRYIERLCRYLRIAPAEFDELCDHYRNPDVWQLNNKGEWELRYRLTLDT